MLIEFLLLLAANAVIFIYFYLSGLNCSVCLIDSNKPVIGHIFYDVIMGKYLAIHGNIDIRW